ncbi:glutathione S-transferase [Echria macrotheca]|uniref:Glutathione S-transferase n=1 Tax=Echria macrotheca TaxID=438768 RepID=A0AAJ0B6U6_9PEZI|nr:glutathione S-transferase [Echria macrotheca]
MLNLTSPHRLHHLNTKRHNLNTSEITDMASTEEIPKPKIKLYWLNDSRAQRIVWLLEELGLDYEVVIFHRDPQTMFAPPELARVHPLGKAPAVGLTYPGEENETVLVESGFITQYLCDRFGEGTGLVPPRYAPGDAANEGKKETEAWMRYQHLLHYAEGSLMPPLLVALILSIMKGPKIPFFIRPVVGAVADKLYAVFVRPNMEKHLAFLEQLLDTAPSGGPYLCGDKLTAADILMSYPLLTVRPRLQPLESKGKLLEGYPKLWAYVDRLEKEEGYKRAMKRMEKVEGTIRGK